MYKHIKDVFIASFGTVKQSDIDYLLAFALEFICQ